jgi:hypothetical protein
MSQLPPATEGARSANGARFSPRLASLTKRQSNQPVMMNALLSVVVYFV